MDFDEESEFLSIIALLFIQLQILLACEVVIHVKNKLYTVVYRLLIKCSTSILVIVALAC